MERIVALDRHLFLLINGMQGGWWDQVMLAASAMSTWFPLYLAFLYFIARLHGWRALAWGVPLIVLMILCSDTGSVVLFKETVHRLRPCHEPALQGMVQLVDGHCGGRFGFVSSHASNHFAIAAFMSAILRPAWRWAPAVLLAWAAFVAYSRVHLGVHYPGDVLVGAIYGFMIGSIHFFIFRHIQRWRTST